MRPLTPEREKPKTGLFRALSIAQFWGPGPQPTVIVSFLLLYVLIKNYCCAEVSVNRGVDKEDVAAAALLPSCLTLCDPIDSSPPGSPVLGILHARTLEWVAISLSNA